mmetsp:Transcript_7828/g.29305  ORF Transcript_7828/g.29305 Transcript_7828/m.29305 type:complete len:252 (+) Transcript_7828:59-814(+)
MHIRHFTFRRLLPAAPTMTQSSHHNKSSLLLLLMLSLTLFSVVHSSSSSSSSSSSHHQQQNVKLNLFIMSKCPDVRDYFVSLFDALMASPVASIVDLRVDFVATQDETAKYGFKSLHGDSEVQGDLIEGCLQNMVTPHNQTNFYKTLSCATNYYRAIPQYIQTCMTQHLPQFSFHDVEQCAYGPTGKQLMLESITKTHELNVRNSPTLYIDGEMVCEWNGRSCPYTKLEQYQKAICQKKLGDKPEFCNKFQ